MLTFILMMTDGGDRDKLEELYITYHRELFCVALEILKDYHDAEDVLQSAFIRMSKHLDKIGEIKCKKTRAYVVIIVRNLALDRYRQRKKTILTDFTTENNKGNIKDESISLEEHVLHLERGKELAKALGRLHSDYADILTLKYYYEYSNIEISELINMTSENVSVKLCRAKAALKKILSEGGGVYE